MHVEESRKSNVSEKRKKPMYGGYKMVLDFYRRRQNYKDIFRASNWLILGAIHPILNSIYGSNEVVVQLTMNYFERPILLRC